MDAEASQDPTALREQLAEAREALERLEEYYTTLLSHVAHDLRAPLGVILGALGELEGEAEDLTSAESIVMLRLMGRGARRLSHYTDNLLELARLDTGRFRLQPSASDVAELVRQAVARIEGIEGEHALELVLDIPEEGVSAHLDAARTALLITNLLGQALRFASRRVELTLSPRDDRVVVEVTDDGTSRTPEEVASAIEPGWGFGSDGADLGLALVGAVARVQGGSCRVAGGPGGGLRLTVELPRQVQGSA